MIPVDASHTGYGPVQTPVQLSPATVYLWFSFVDEIKDKQLLADYLDLLPASEIEKYRSYRFDRHRKRYLIGRALLRTVLSHCTGLAPNHIEISREDHGRPYILPSAMTSPPQFSLSYTDGLVAAALTAECIVGIDVEHTEKEIDYIEISENYFSTPEYWELKQLPEDQRKKRFFELWTLKEAYVKAQGRGLHIPLDEVSFHLRDEMKDPPNQYSILSEDGLYFQLRSFTPSEFHSASFCVCINPETPFKVISKEVIPLVSEKFSPSMDDDSKA